MKTGEQEGRRGRTRKLTTLTTAATTTTTTTTTTKTTTTKKKKREGRRKGRGGGGGGRGGGVRSVAGWWVRSAMKAGNKQRRARMLRRCFASFRQCVRGGEDRRPSLHEPEDLTAFAAMPLLESPDLQNQHHHHQQDGLGPSASPDLTISSSAADPSQDGGRPRAGSSGSSNFKLFGKSRGGPQQRSNRPSEELTSSSSALLGGSRNGASPSPSLSASSSASSKMKSFLDTFRPRSKSDVSGMKKPGKKIPREAAVGGGGGGGGGGAGAESGGGLVGMDRSLDESSLSGHYHHHRHHQQQNIQYVPGFVSKAAGGSADVSMMSPMGQILEGQLLGVAGSAGAGGGADAGVDRVRHRSAVAGGGGGGGGTGSESFSFMSKFRTRSNSDSKTKGGAGAPRRPQSAQVAASPDDSPKLRDKKGALSPLRPGSGEPRSAPPVSTGRAASFDHTHAIIYKGDVMKLSLESDPDRMEIEDLDENEDQVYSKFMRAHKCYDLIPTSAKLVIFDTQLNVKKAFFALVYNGVRAAPLWDSVKQDYVGMLTITDFINILKQYYKEPNTSAPSGDSTGHPEVARMDELEDHKIATWREVLRSGHRPFVSIDPDASLYEAVKALVDNRVHRLPVVDSATGNAIYILTHKRLLRFLHIYLRELPTPGFMSKTIKELGIGTFTSVVTVSKNVPLIQALNLFVEHRISALPVLDDEGIVCDIYAKFDVINLAAEKTYNNLDISVEQALRHRSGGNNYEGVATCQDDDRLQDVIETIVKAEVHRLVAVDENSRVKGIVSLSDILNYIILRPMDLGTEAAAAAPESLRESTS